MIKPAKMPAEYMTHVWTDLEKFIQMCAREHTIANMGQEVEDFDTHGRPEHVVDNAYHQMLNDICTEDEMVDGIEEEYRSWLKDARRDALRVQKAGLPLCLWNARLAFENKGPFAKKK
jgi:hypothetical protein